jgi:hypothetical protein
VALAHCGGREQGRNGPRAAGNGERPPGVAVGLQAAAGLTSRSLAGAVRGDGFKECGIRASPDGMCQLGSSAAHEVVEGGWAAARGVLLIDGERGSVEILQEEARGSFRSGTGTLWAAACERVWRLRRRQSVVAGACCAVGLCARRQCGGHRDGSAAGHRGGDARGNGRRPGCPQGGGVGAQQAATARGSSALGVRAAALGRMGNKEARRRRGALRTPLGIREARQRRWGRPGGRDAGESGSPGWAARSPARGDGRRRCCFVVASWG